ncbi:activating signal cointegrator 1-like [Sycon ciliatum]|uniref:activating signal cointegrator 1-like n=1 Tax=Sycon ciliatum TaxID=27933 RepID=UPI0031F6C622
MSDTALKHWISKELGKVLKYGDAESEHLDDQATYILSIESLEDLKEYMSDLLGRYRKGSNKDVFVEQLVRRWHPHAKSVPAPADMVGYRKHDNEEMLLAPRKEPKTGKVQEGNSPPPGLSSSPAAQPHSNQTHSRPTGRKAKSITASAPPGFVKKLSEAVAPTTSTVKNVNGSNGSGNGSGSSGTKGGRRKFVTMTSARTSALQVPGRHVCECQASRHPLVANCIRCGRIVCEQEGAGPCLFCGELVTTAADREVLARESKRSAKLREKLQSVPGGGMLQQLTRQPVAGNGDSAGGGNGLSPSASPALRKAEELKTRLLDYDKTSVQRTRVIDDESDYFAADTNSWLSKEDRKTLQARQEELHEQRHATRSQRKVTIDFAGRRVLDDEESKMKQSDALYGGEDPVLKALQDNWRKPTAAPSASSCTAGATTDQDPRLGLTSIANPTVEKQLTYVDEQKTKRTHQAAPSANSHGRVRIQDKELLEMRDEGACLSMHQPWATLLVAGIKRDEGRTWYTSHRGRLWIASAAKPVDQQDVDTIECFYRNRPEGNDMVFPNEYPTGALLGCVDVEDCLEQTEYRQKFPNGESESPYVWICSNPRDLLIKFPVKGKHKLWKLDDHVHKAAQRCLQ